ncbi:MAG TPA: dTMP kinase [Lautropia sp.]|jgi:dTMP kinase|nr:dTMP kinase [Lautropia sp.]
MTGRFITFEGIDGAGKSTHLPRFAQSLREQGIAVLVAREPGGTVLAELIRDWFLNQVTDAQTEALLAFAARSDHLTRRIRPALAAGQWVVCDRFTDSTIAYQGGGRELGTERVQELERWLRPSLEPDRTYLFDLDPAVAAQRRAKARAADRFEAEDLAFFERVRQAYHARAAADGARLGTAGRRIVIVDAGQTADEIWTCLQDDLAACLARWNSH